MQEFLERLFPSLGKKVAIAVIIGSLIAWGSFVFFAQQTGYSILEKEAQAKAHGIAALVDGILTHVIREENGAQVQSVLELALTSPDIVDAFLVSANGQFLWRARAFPPMDSLAVSSFLTLNDSIGEKYLTAREHDSVFEYVIIPLRGWKRTPIQADTLHGVPPRYFGMKISMADVRAIAISHRSTNIVMTIVIFAGMGILIYLILLFLVVNPIRSLRAHIENVQSDVKKLAHGERTVFPLFPAPLRYDEIAELHEGFNHLLQRLNEANARLIEMHQVQLEQADRLATTGEMAASMAHEIKNPIAGVLSVLQVFSGEIDAGGTRKEIIAEMLVQLERVIHAVNDLLQYARPTPPVFEIVDIQRLIEKTVAMLSRQCKGKDIAIQTNFSSSPLGFSADKKQLQQVLWNIVLNAIQAIDNAGTITIETHASDESIFIRVSDDGKGIAPDQLEQIFKPFFTTKHKGTGLGMTISRRIVEQHHGTLTVTSRPGKGTMIVITLPKFRPEDREK
jgi:signal transduction histidine kinase